MSPHASRNERFVLVAVNGGGAYESKAVGWGGRERVRESVWNAGRGGPFLSLWGRRRWPLRRRRGGVRQVERAGLRLTASACLSSTTRAHFSATHNMCSIPVYLRPASPFTGVPIRMARSSAGHLHCGDARTFSHLSTTSASSSTHPHQLPLCRSPPGAFPIWVARSSVGRVWGAIGSHTLARCPSHG